jgi:hypothetical protein
MKVTRNDKEVRQIASRVSTDLWGQFDAKQYLAIAKEIYPIAVDGIANNVSSSDQKRDTHIRATNAAQELLKQGATGFSVNLTSPAREWFELGSALTIEDVYAKHDLDRGLETLTGAIREVFEVCGIYRELDKAYEHLLAFGTACMLILPNQTGTGFKYINATTLRFGTYALGIGADGMVNRCSRKFEMTPAQIAERFGMDAVPGDWRDRIAKGEGHKDKITIVNLIEPNGEPTHDKVAGHCGFNEGGWRSLYWAEWGSRRSSGEEERPILAVRFVRHRPIIAPRLEREAGDVWGRGRGVDALPAARALNALRRDLINISGNTADPALFIDASLQNQSLKLGRGGITYYNGREGVPPSQLAIPFASGYQVLLEQQNDLRQELADTFFVSRFATINALKTNPGVKTATEIEQLVRENMGLLGPVVTNLEQEFLNPLVLTVVQTTLDVARAEGFNLDDLGPVLDGQMKIRYVGEVHAAMKSSNLNALNAITAFVGGLIQTSGDPTLMSVVDTDAIIREYADASGVKPTCMRQPEDVEAMRQQREMAAQQAQQAQTELQQAQALKAGAGALKDASATPFGQDLIGGMM